MEENYDARLQNLTSEVDKVSTEKKISFSFMGKTMNNMYIYSFLIPVMITILLMVFKPSFILQKSKTENINVINYKKVFIVFSILTIVTVIVNYSYFYKKKSSF